MRPPRSARRRPWAPALRRIEVDGVAVEDCAAAAFLDAFLMRPTPFLTLP